MQVVELAQNPYAHKLVSKLLANGSKEEAAGAPPPPPPPPTPPAIPTQGSAIAPSFSSKQS